MRRKNQDWKPKVKMVSSLHCEGIEEVWATMTSFKETMISNQHFINKRRIQRKQWMWNYIQLRLAEVKIFQHFNLKSIFKQSLLQMFHSHPSVHKLAPGLESKVMNYAESPGSAADKLLQNFFKDESKS